VESQPVSEAGANRPLERKVTDWRLRTRSLELGRRTLIMGVVNITPTPSATADVSSIPRRL